MLVLVEHICEVIQLDIVLLIITCYTSFIGRT